MFINTIFLYLLIFSNYFFGFISVPYQTRILGPEFYGRVGFAVAFMTYFRLIIDFGFLLSATESISINRENKNEISKIVTSVNIVKIILILFSLFILILMLVFIPRFQEDKLLYVLMFIAVTTGSLLPDYLYRGVEQMKILTWRTIVIQAFFVSLIFIFLKNENQYYLIPIFTFLGNLISVFFTYIHAFRKLGLRFVKVERKYILDTFKRSSTFFYSRIASKAFMVPQILFYWV
ncbi:oligosaccharide flippase family protein [Exiguobacterium sp. SL14]|nr:oligosaccharide flippase family protein [Exiguobacterium sp. SL14]MCY1689910.1 oligosaccharide flippase family protein [Exiguobacterium sp. SL14]